MSRESALPQQNVSGEQRPSHYGQVAGSQPWARGSPCPTACCLLLSLPYPHGLSLGLLFAFNPILPTQFFFSLPPPLPPFHFPESHRYLGKYIIINTSICTYLIYFSSMKSFRLPQSDVNISCSELSQLFEFLLCH